jgi:hypothetical protein
MERLHQMFVIPDVLPELHPTLDLAITVRRRPGEFKRELKPFTNVEPGTYTLPQQVWSKCLFLVICLTNIKDYGTTPPLRKCLPPRGAFIHPRYG